MLPICHSADTSWALCTVSPAGCLPPHPSCEATLTPATTLSPSPPDTIAPAGDLSGYASLGFTQRRGRMTPADAVLGAFESDGECVGVWWWAGREGMAKAGMCTGGND